MIAQNLSYIFRLMLDSYYIDNISCAHISEVTNAEPRLLVIDAEPSLSFFEKKKRARIETELRL